MTTSARPAQVAYKRSIKNYLLDARFQLKWTGMIIGVALVISAIMGHYLYKTSTKVVDESQKVIAEEQKLIDESRKNSDLVKMTIKKEYADSPELADTFNKSAEDLDKGLLEKQNTLYEQQRQTVHQQNTMLGSLVLGLAILVVLIGILGIYFTHKVVGPIYKMKLLLRQVGDGKLNFEGRLRKGDELQDFFEAFTAMVEKLKARQAAEVSELEVGMEKAKESGASEEAIEKIRVVRDAMRASLDR